MKLQDCIGKKLVRTKLLRVKDFTGMNCTYTEGVCVFEIDTITLSLIGELVRFKVSNEKTGNSNYKEFKLDSVNDGNWKEVPKEVNLTMETWLLRDEISTEYWTHETSDVDACIKSLNDVQIKIKLLSTRTLTIEED